MKKLVSCLLAITLFCGASMGQEKRPPEKELKAQVNHVKSSGNDLLHLRFKKAHEKHVAEANRRNKGIVKDVNGQGKALPKPATPPAPKLPAPKRPPLR
ncbi:MAG: hypothetical protein V4539_19750 [Bacteroidota bacterium]